MKKASSTAENDAARQRVAELFGLDTASENFLAAITHPSFAHESPGEADNQRLEFLGDAILDFIVSDELFDRFQDSNEGQLTKTRSQLVSTGALCRYAQAHEIGLALRFGKGAGQGSLHASENVLADAVEALIAATYRDRGTQAAKDVCLRIMEFGLESMSSAARDTKSELQEKVQALGLRAPTYRVLGSEGPAHEVTFEVEVSVDGIALATGKGRSKRLAERQAASLALSEKNYQQLVRARDETALSEEAPNESEQA